MVEYVKIEGIVKVMDGSECVDEVDGRPPSKMLDDRMCRVDGVL